MICERLFRMQDAISHYQKALEYSPGYSPAWHRFAWISFGLGIEKEMLDFLTKHEGRISEHVRNVLLEVAVDVRNRKTSERLLGQPGTWPVNPILYACFLIQNNENEQARLFLQQLAEEHPEFSMESHLYLWALSMKEDDWSAGMKWIEKLSIAEHSFSAVEALLKGDPVYTIPLSACRRCQQALLRSGAWRALLHFLRLLRPGLAIPWLPVRMMTVFLTAPTEYRQSLIELISERQNTISFEEFILSGVIAHSVGDFTKAVTWFQAARKLDTARLEPLAGLAASYFDMAKYRYGNFVLPLQITPQLCLIGL
jgi:hypothetical protein